MKLLITLILMITLYSKCNATETWKCIKSGGRCTTNGGDICPNGEFCKSNGKQLYDSSGNELPSGICSPLIKEGEPCYLYQRCEYGLLCKVPPTQFPGEEYSVEGVCISSKYLSVGENCTSDSECLGRLECKGNICTPENSEIGNQCYLDEDCPSQNYCNWSTSLNNCEPLKKISDACLNDNQCSLGLICRNDKCIEMFSLKIGEPCQTREDCESLNCNYNLLDSGERNVTTINNGFYCQVKELNTDDCKKDGCKGSYEICDSKSNKCLNSNPINSKKCSSATKLRDNCYIKNKCSLRNHFNVEQRNKKSCQIKNCQSEINEYLKECILETVYCQ
ncbi:hypothetical protein RB653_008011 [Dictyostelium firmibasis]|uniref:Dickkopf N-terminal cysteine-rich domain-containing protein n=1 Tax=Dictyostelium firmibasis TaxID=79012 RepID=A0AAN7YQS4_9MYCE